MTAKPMTLDEALNHQGFTIEEELVPETTITIDEGTIVIPESVRSRLVWQRDELGPAQLGDDLWLSSIPIFDNDYKPFLLSSILDHYRTRRLAYNTPGQWRLAYRRWMNLHMSLYNQRYRSAAVQLPLDDRDSTTKTEGTVHGLDIGSDFPQSLISGSADYASAATDRRQAVNTEVRDTGRGVSTMELLRQQREVFLNVDAEIIAALESLFLGVFDGGEGEPEAQYGIHPTGWPRLTPPWAW